MWGAAPATTAEPRGLRASSPSGKAQDEGGHIARSTKLRSSTVRFVLSFPASTVWLYQAILIGVEDIYAGTGERVWARRESADLVGTAVLTAILRDVLQEAPGRHAVDLGGGNGYWSQVLVNLGYSPVLVDISLSLIYDSFPRGGCYDRLLGDARSIPLQADCMDVCLCFGPMYGTGQKADQPLIASEMLRILRPGGLVVVEGMTLMGCLRALMLRAPDALGELDWSALKTTGRVNSKMAPEFHATQLFQDPEELADVLGRAGLRVQSVHGYDGPSSVLSQARLRHLPTDMVGRVTDVLRQVVSEPTSWSSADQYVICASK